MTFDKTTGQVELDNNGGPKVVDKFSDEKLCTGTWSDHEDSESADLELGDGEKIRRKDLHEKDRTVLGCIAPLHVLKGIFNMDYKNIVWTNILVAVVYHLAGCFGIYNLIYKAQWKTVAFYFLYHLGCGLGVTAGMHRLWSHKSYRAGTIMQIFLAFWATAAAQNSIYVWCRDHRVHHKFSETDADPHNAQRGLFFAHIGWLLKKKHPSIKVKGKDIDMKDLERNKIIKFQHTHYYILLLICGVLIPWFLPVFAWGESFTVAYFVMVTRMMTTHHFTWLVNSVAHWEGPTPYDKTIWPVENFVVAICALGEGWHNFHHAFPNDYRASDRYDGIKDIYLNFTRVFIDACHTLGLCSNKIVAPEALIAKVMNEFGDGYPEESRYQKQRCNESKNK